MKKFKIASLVSTGLLTALMLMSAGMYIFNHAEMAATFLSLGFPDYLLYPLAAAKIMGLLALWFSKSNALKEWAYAGFFFNAILALAAHLGAGDGEFPGAVMALILIGISYFTWGKLAKGE